MSYRIYDVSESGLDYCAYDIKVNGVPAAPDSARVSAVPFNRRWPGHQRPLDQTELVNFLSLATDEPLHFEITPREPFEQVEIRPRALHIQPEVKNGVITFTLPGAAYFTVEPYGRRNALHIFVDPMPQYEDLPRDDGSVLYFGKGVHDVGMLELQSNQTLLIDEGAIVYACIRAKEAKNIRILGRGILDNSRNRERILFPVSAEYNATAVNNCVREHTIQLEYCEDVQIEGITIRDSLVYNIRPLACRRLRISNVKILGWRYNSDGIDMHNCEDVRIENCFLRTFDDSICVKGFDCYYEGDVEQAVHDAMYYKGGVYDCFRTVYVRGCVIWNDWGRCLEIGAETRAKEICDVRFEDCHIIHATMEVLDCQNVDYADVHDLVWRNIDIEYDACIPAPLVQNTDRETYENRDLDYAPPVLCAVVAFHPEYSAGGEKRGRNRNILFENIRLFGRQKPIFCIKGFSDDAACENITVRGFYHNGKRLSLHDPYELQTNQYCKNLSFLPDAQD